MSQYGYLIARNLKRFRRERNLTQKKLADKTGVSLPCIKKVEGNHIDAPSTATLTKLAAGLGRTIFDFYREPQTLQAVRFRANASFGAAARETIVDSCAVWLDRYCFLEDLLDDKLEFNLPAPTMTGSKLDVREYSAEIRSRLGFTPSEPIANVSDALVRSGAKFWFCRRPGPEDVFGLAFAESPQRTGVVVFDTDAINAERRIFSAIHELGHLALHQKSFDIQIADENPDEESQADLFASHFLMPNDEFVRRWEDSVGRPFVDRVLFVKKYFRVSYKTVLWRLVEIGREKQGVYGKFNALYNRRHPDGLKQHREPEGLSKLDVSDDRFRRLVFRATKAGKITPGKAAEFLGTSVPETYAAFNSTESVE